MTSRRHILKAGLLGGGAILAGTAWYLKSGSDTRALAASLIGFLEYPKLASETGQRLLRQVDLGADSARGLLEQLSQALKVEPDKLPVMPADELLLRLQQRVRQDFVDERIAVSDGWILSMTEAQLCALFFLSAQN